MTAIPSETTPDITVPQKHTLEVTITPDGPDTTDKDRPYLANILVRNTTRDATVLEEIMEFDTAEEMSDWMRYFDQKLTGTWEGEFTSAMKKRVRSTTLTTMAGATAAILAHGLHDAKLLAEKTAEKISEKLPGSTKGKDEDPDSAPEGDNDTNA